MKKAKIERAAPAELMRREFSAAIERPADTEGARVVDVCFATAAPVRRMMAGETVDEVLEITAAAMDLERLNTNGPLLLEHDRQVGAVVRAWVGDDGKARARVKFSRSRLASEAFQDVEDSILRAVSVGYSVQKWERCESGDGKSPATMRAARWTPHEISLVSQPADIHAGVGRSVEFVGGGEIETEKTETKQMSVEIVKEQRNDAREIATLGNRHGAAAEAASHIEQGASVEQFKTFLIERQAAKPIAARVFTKEGAADGAPAENYSFIGLIRALADGRTLPEREALEHERLSRTHGRGGAGFLVPAEVFKRTVTVASSPAYVGTQVMEAVPALSADSLAVRLGARVITGLSSKAVWPKQGRASAQFLAETATATPSNPDATGLTLDAKRLCAQVQVSKRLLAQGADIESTIKADIILQMSLELDRQIFAGVGGVGLTGIINTAGVGTAVGPASRAAAVALEGAVAGANGLGSNMAYVMTPAIASALKNEQLGTSGRFALEGRELLGYAAHSSTQVPAGQLIFGDWSQVLIGVFGSGGVELTVDAAGSAASGIINIVCNQYVDAGLRHEASFAILS